MRCKLGPSAFAAGMSEPSLSQVTQVEWAGPPVRSKKKLCTSTPVLEVKIRCPGMQARTESRHEWDPTSSLPALDAQDTRMQGDQRKWVISERRSAFACCKARFAIEDRALEDSAPICALAVLS